jgi:hypothetical protein
MGRKLYQNYQGRLCVLLGLEHRVHYLRPGDAVKLGFRPGHYRERSTFEPAEQEGYLLLEGNPVFPYLLSWVSINHLWGCWGAMESCAVRQMWLNDVALELPVTPAPEGAPMA